MSAKKQSQRAVNPFTLRKRRWLLGLLILFQACVVIGSQGPWYTACRGEEDLWTVGGPKFAVRSAPPPVPVNKAGVQQLNEPPPAPPEPGMFGRPGLLAHSLMLLAILAFFFSSFDLVADADIQLPGLVISGVILALAAYAFYAIYSPSHTLGRIIEEVEATQVVKSGHQPGDDVAPVTSGELDQSSILSNMPKLRFGWGASLLFAAAPLMLLVSVYLTFFAVRTPERL